jgi:hypothetical protein
MRMHCAKVSPHFFRLSEALYRLILSACAVQSSRLPGCCCLSRFLGQYSIGSLQWRNSYSRFPVRAAVLSPRSSTGPSLDEAWAIRPRWPIEMRQHNAFRGVDRGSPVDPLRLWICFSEVISALFTVFHPLRVPTACSLRRPLMFTMLNARSVRHSR